MVTLVHNAISDVSEPLYPIPVKGNDPKLNPGSWQFVRKEELGKYRGEVLGQPTQSITMASLLSGLPRSSTLIVKMDIQGKECRALRSLATFPAATKMPYKATFPVATTMPYNATFPAVSKMPYNATFPATITMPYIFMEWNELAGSAKRCPDLDGFIHLLESEGYSARWSSPLLLLSLLSFRKVAFPVFIVIIIIIIILQGGPPSWQWCPNIACMLHQLMSFGFTSLRGPYGILTGRWIVKCTTEPKAMICKDF